MNSPKGGRHVDLLLRVAGSVLVAQGLALRSRQAAVLVLACCLLCISALALGSADEFAAAGEGWRLYSFKDPYMSGQQFLRSRQELAQGHGKRGEVAREIFGAIVTECSFTYLAFNLSIADDLTLFVPKGEGNFTLTLVTPNGPAEVSDQGVFVFPHNNNERIAVLTTVGPTATALFVNPNKVMLNNTNEEPRVVLRFASGLNLDQIVSMTASDDVKPIARR